MMISYCVTCCGRLWQLKKTIAHNLDFTRKDEFEICILAYNDKTVLPYLQDNFPDHIADGRLKIKEIIDPIPYTCGRVKNFSHEMGMGDILFNLDADNFICNAHQHLLELKPNEIIQANFKGNIGVVGRIGVYKDEFYKVGGYRDVGRDDDGDFIRRCVNNGLRIRHMPCDIDPIPNIPNEEI